MIYFHYSKEKKRKDPAYQIVALMQTTSGIDMLKTGHLAELLGLSIDYPSNLYDYDKEAAAKKLMQLPLVKEAKVTKIRPGTIHIDYLLRQPIAYLGDCTNTAIDAEGVVFPFKPFFTPKRLPEIYLQNREEKDIPLWGSQLEGERKELAFKLLVLAPDYCDSQSTLRSIDVSDAFATSDGRRQIVLMLEEHFTKIIQGKVTMVVRPLYLRLREDNLSQQLGNYLVLRTYLREKGKLDLLEGEGAVRQAKAMIIDLRLSELAFFAQES